jgi:hypothetical protein
MPASGVHNGSPCWDHSPPLQVQTLVVFNKITVTVTVTVHSAKQHEARELTEVRETQELWHTSWNLGTL